MSELRRARFSIMTYMSQSILLNASDLRPGDVFVRLDRDDAAWWRVLTRFGIRYVWFPEFEKSEVLE